MRRLLVLIVVALLGGPRAALASGLCDVPYFLPVSEGASWTFARDAAPRSIHHVRPDGFEVHSTFPTTYQGQPDVINHVDTYRCGPDGLSLVQHSEIDEAAQAGLFSGVYQGLALPRTIGPGADWEYSYVTAGGDPTQPPVEDEFRDHVTEHFHVLGPGTLTLGNGQQVQGLRVQHSVVAIGVSQSAGESPDFNTDRVDFLAQGIGWVTPELLAYSAGSQSFDQCPGQAGADAALHSAEDSLVSGSSTELVIAQAGTLGSAAFVKAFGDAGIPPDQVSVDPSNGLLRFVIRLDGSGQRLMLLVAIDQLTASACVQPGTLQGAATLLVGALQQNGDQIRVTARRVDMATGQIHAATLADGQAAGLAETLQSALSGLGG